VKQFEIRVTESLVYTYSVQANTLEEAARMVDQDAPGVELVTRTCYGSVVEGEERK
jgi:hypothetical protein